MPDVMVPDGPFHTDIERIGIGGKCYEAQREGLVGAERAAIDSFVGPETVRLDTGVELPADLVICATGWRQSVGFLDSDLRRKVEADGRFQLYRHILPPGEPRVGFNGYGSSGNAPLTSELAAHWLSQCFRGELALPQPDDMEREIERVRRWTADVFPGRPEGYFIGAFVSHYADELMRDMELPTRRADSPVAEYLAPVWAERYRGVREERRLARRGENVRRRQRQ